MSDNEEWLHKKAHEAMRSWVDWQNTIGPEATKGFQDLQQRLQSCADELERLSAAMTVVEPDELYAELRKENERLKAERDAYGDSNVKLVNRLAVLESIRDRLLAWGETVALYVLEDMPKLGGIIAAAKASKEKET